jgi:hypothetical protein
MGGDEFAESYLQNTGGYDELDLRALELRAPAPRVSLPAPPFWGSESQGGDRPEPEKVMD